MFKLKNLFKKTNECWEFKKCAKDIKEKCPAFLNNKTLECWSVDGTLCASSPTDEFAKKLKDCTACDFYIKMAWDLEPTESHKDFVKKAVQKLIEKKATLVIEKILNDNINRFKEAASVKNITIEVSIPQNFKSVDGEFFGNQKELSHVLLHFISKCLTYAKPDSTLYLRADDVGEHIQVGIIFSNQLTGSILHDKEKISLGTAEGKREMLSEEIINQHGGRCWEEINPSGRSGLFFTLAKDRRAFKAKEAKAVPDSKERRI